MSQNTTGHLVASALLCGELLFGLSARPAQAQVLEWVRQPGGTIAEPEYSEGVSADGLGNVYIAGSGGLAGFPPPGFGDAFLIKYDAAGNHQWTQKIETDLTEAAFGVSADGLGNVYISGQTGGSLLNTAADAFLSKYNGAGVLQWTRQSGLE